jgi:hypothetical protein
MYTKFVSENLKGRYYSEDVDVDGRIILEWILEILSRTNLAQDMDQ